MDEKSKEFLMINTHQGLYCYERLPIGVASAPAIFQRHMGSVLQGVKGVRSLLHRRHLDQQCNTRGPPQHPQGSLQPPLEAQVLTKTGEKM